MLSPRENHARIHPAVLRVLVGHLVVGAALHSGTLDFFAAGFFPQLEIFSCGGRRAPAVCALWRDPGLAWHLIYPRRPRSIWGWVHNPGVNLALSQQNLVDHLAHDLNHLPDQSDPRDLVAYRLVQALDGQRL